jgi:hypothetical protein
MVTALADGKADVVRRRSLKMQRLEIEATRKVDHKETSRDLLPHRWAAGGKVLISGAYFGYGG